MGASKIIVIRSEKPAENNGLFGAKWLTEGVALVLLPVLLYLLAMAGALGRANRLGYPALLIGSTHLTLASNLLPLAAFAIYFVLVSILGGMCARGNRIWRGFGVFLFLATLLPFLVMSMPMPPAIRMAWVLGALCFSVTVGLWTALCTKGVPNRNALDERVGWLRLKHLVLGAAVISSLSFAYFFGFEAAGHRDEFWVVVHEGARIAILDTEGTRAVGRVLEGENVGAVVVVELANGNALIVRQKVERWWMPADEARFDASW